VLALLVPVLAAPFRYEWEVMHYSPSNGWADIGNWRFACTPVFCLFLFGSASKGCAGRFAAFFSADVLVNFGDISLAAYCFQTTMARNFSLQQVLGGGYVSWFNERARCIAEIARLAPLGKQAELDPLCQPNPPELFVMMFFALFALGGIYTVAIEPALITNVRAFLSKMKSLYCGIDTRQSIKKRDDLLPQLQKKTLRAGADGYDASRTGFQRFFSVFSPAGSKRSE